MAIDKGDQIPAADLVRIGDDGPETVAIKDYVAGRKVVIFALPGAYTGTCSTAHVPSFIRVQDELKAKGIDEVICISVNDPFVLQAWGEATGATAAGITMLGDASSAFARGMGRQMDDAAAVGLYGRSKRYAMVVDNGVVQSLQAEAQPGVCDVSGGESILASL